MDYVQSSYNFKGVQVTMTWMPEREFRDYEPVTQVYGIVFNDKGEILIARESSSGKWQLPGGKPEKGESIEETVRRELLEEVDVKAGIIYPLGVQKTEMPGNPNQDEGDLFYQVRCVVELGELLPQTPDPDRGNVWERMFVSAEKVTEYIKWGTVGDAMFADAIKLWKEKHQTS